MYGMIGEAFEMMDGIVLASLSTTECNACPPVPPQVYTSEQYERLTSWAARAESGSAMAHLWSPDDGTFLSRYVSSSAAQNSSEVCVGRGNWEISPENVIDSAVYFFNPSGSGFHIFY